MALKQYDDATHVTVPRVTHVVLTREDFDKLSEAVKSGKTAKKKLTAVAADLKVLAGFQHYISNPMALLGDTEALQTIEKQLTGLPALIEELTKTAGEDA